MSKIRVTGDVVVSGPADQIAADFALEVVIPLAAHVAGDQGLDALRLFYLALIQCLLCQARGAFTPAEVSWIAERAAANAAALCDDDAPRH